MSTRNDNDCEEWGDTPLASAVEATTTTTTTTNAKRCYKLQQCHPPRDSTDDETKYISLKLVCMGEGAVGKTTLLKRFEERKFLKDRNQTVSVERIAMCMKIENDIYPKASVVMWDTAGQERFRANTKQYFRDSDGVMLVFDATSSQSFTQLAYWRQMLAEMCEDTIVALVCNKSDLYGQKKADGSFVYRQWMKKHAMDEVARQLDCDAGFFMCSAKDSSNAVIDEIFLSLIEAAANNKIAIEKEEMRASNVINLNIEGSVKHKFSCCGK